ncbi:hypothetical protein Daus18300_011946 [Diaporthe australafricana]|uniref:Vacuolar ATPase assembly integral membrane protein VMA21 n=1 Tax=Diaporthe australafricana TaxID=127596 RepID=A0ABR3W4M2_9PEZI
MASMMPTRKSIRGLDLSMCVLFQHDSADFSSMGRRSHNLPGDESMDTLNLYQGCQVVTTHPIARPIAGNANLEDRPDLDSQPTSISPLRPPLGDVPSSASDVEATHPAADGEHGSNRALSIHHKFTKAARVVLSVVIPSFILVPGVVLGALMKQVTVGIELSGTITAVLGMYAGFYYYHNRKGR